MKIKRRSFLKGLMGLIPATFIAGKVPMSFDVTKLTIKPIVDPISPVSPSQPDTSMGGSSSPSSSTSPSEDDIESFSMSISGSISHSPSSEIEEDDESN